VFLLGDRVEGIAPVRGLNVPDDGPDMQLTSSTSMGRVAASSELFADGCTLRPRAARCGY
jgi:hypothetical protein